MRYTGPVRWSFADEESGKSEYRQLGRLLFGIQRVFLAGVGVTKFRRTIVTSNKLKFQIIWDGVTAQIDVDARERIYEFEPPPPEGSFVFIPRYPTHGLSDFLVEARLVTLIKVSPDGNLLGYSYRDSTYGTIDWLEDDLPDGVTVVEYILYANPYEYGQLDWQDSSGRVVSWGRTSDRYTADGRPRGTGAAIIADERLAYGSESGTFSRSTSGPTSTEKWVFDIFDASYNFSYNWYYRQNPPFGFRSGVNVEYGYYYELCRDEIFHEGHIIAYASDFGIFESLIMGVAAPQIDFGGGVVKDFLVVCTADNGADTSFNFYVVEVTDFTPGSVTLGTPSLITSISMGRAAQDGGPVLFAPSGLKCVTWEVTSVDPTVYPDPRSQYVEFAFVPDPDPALWTYSGKTVVRDHVATIERSGDQLDVGQSWQISLTHNPDNPMRLGYSLATDTTSDFVVLDLGRMFEVEASVLLGDVLFTTGRTVTATDATSMDFDTYQFDKVPQGEIDTYSLKRKDGSTITIPNITAGGTPSVISNNLDIGLRWQYVDYSIVDPCVYTRTQYFYDYDLSSNLIEGVFQSVSTVTKSDFWQEGYALFDVNSVYTQLDHSSAANLVRRNHDFAANTSVTLTVDGVQLFEDSDTFDFTCQYTLITGGRPPEAANVFEYLDNIYNDHPSNMMWPSIYGGAALGTITCNTVTDAPYNDPVFITGTLEPRIADVFSDIHDFYQAMEATNSGTYKARFTNTCQLHALDLRCGFAVYERVTWESQADCTTQIKFQPAGAMDYATEPFPVGSRDTNWWDVVFDGNDTYHCYMAADTVQAHSKVIAVANGETFLNRSDTVSFSGIPTAEATQRASQPPTGLHDENDGNRTYYFYRRDHDASLAPATTVDATAGQVQSFRSTSAAYLAVPQWLAEMRWEYIMSNGPEWVSSPLNIPTEYKNYDALFLAEASDVGDVPFNSYGSAAAAIVIAADADVTWKTWFWDRPDIATHEDIRPDLYVGSPQEIDDPLPASLNFTRYAHTAQYPPTGTIVEATGGTYAWFGLDWVTDIGPEYFTRFGAFAGEEFPAIGDTPQNHTGYRDHGSYQWPMINRAYALDCNNNASTNLYNFGGCVTYAVRLATTPDAEHTIAYSFQAPIAISPVLSNVDIQYLYSFGFGTADDEGFGGLGLISTTDN